MSPGECLRKRVSNGGTLPLVGVYDSFSTALAARRFEGVFLSGFGFAASYYGLPDVGFMAWPDMVQFAARARAVAPKTHLIVDIDDGFADDNVAIHVAKELQRSGASGAILEDQARPRRCGHLNGKILLPLDAYLNRLNGVLESCSDLFIIARTDATDPGEIRERVSAFSETNADAILVDGQGSLDSIQQLRTLTDKPLAFNQILGGKSPAMPLSELDRAGVAMAILSTPLLFSAQAAMQQCLDDLHENDVRLDAVGSTVRLSECQEVLEENWHLASHFNAQETRDLPNSGRDEMACELVQTFRSE